MHERDDAQPLAFARDLVRQRSEPEPVDEDGRAVWNRRKHPHRMLAGGGRRERKAAIERQHVDGPATLAQPGDDQPVVAVSHL